MKSFTRTAAAALAALCLTLPATAAGEQHPVDNLLHHCRLTQQQLEAGLLYQLKPYAQAYLTAGERTGVCPVFLAAKDALESGWGRHPAASNNLSGWTTDAGSYMSFPDGESCIRHVTQALKENYLTPHGLYYQGYSLEQVNRYYNGSHRWMEEVQGIMRDIQRRINASG